MIGNKITLQSLLSSAWTVKGEILSRKLPRIDVFHLKVRISIKIARGSLSAYYKQER
jgi:hypothetical protein